MTENMLSTWAEVTHQTLGQFGYSKASSMATERLKMPSHGTYNKRLPNGVMIPGFSDYLKVEAALDALPEKHRALLALDQGLIRPPKVELKTVKQRAEYAGISQAGYFNALKEIKLAVEVSRRIHANLDKAI